jgi:hypothetical protein
MACWWRIYCEQKGLTITNNSSWKKIAAIHFGATTKDVKGSWVGTLRALIATAGSPGINANDNKGSHGRTLVDRDKAIEPSHARMLTRYGGRAPLK